jgi:hypothetical protein
MSRAAGALDDRTYSFGAVAASPGAQVRRRRAMHVPVGTAGVPLRPSGDRVMGQESQVRRRNAVYVAVGTAGIPLRPSGDRVMEVEAVEHAKQTRQRQHTKPVAHVEFLKNLVAEKMSRPRNS